MGASAFGAHVESFVERLGRALSGPAILNRAIALQRLGSWAAFHQPGALRLESLI